LDLNILLLLRMLQELPTGCVQLPMTISRNSDVGPVSVRAANSYDFVRFCAACCVLFSHHFDLAGFDEPQVPGYGQDFGELGVEVFFCLSGFLIFLSLQRSTDWVRFAAARALRILPNLCCALVMTSLVTLIWYRNGAHLGAHASYVADNMLLFLRGVTQLIPGVFSDAVRPSLNVPLWTLPYELWLYVSLALIVLLARPRGAAFVVLLTLTIGLAWSLADADRIRTFYVGPLEGFEIFRLGSYFLSGAVVAIIWPAIRRRATAVGFAGLLGVLLVQQLTSINSLLLSFSLALAVIGLGSSRLMAWFGRGGDASYGMYVFAWPVQQFALLVVGAFWPSLLVAFLVTVAIGYATWHGFEKRAMTYPDVIADALRARRYRLKLPTTST